MRRPSANNSIDPVGRKDLHLANSAPSCPPSPPLLFAVAFIIWVHCVLASHACRPRKDASRMDSVSVIQNSYSQVFNQLGFPILQPQ